MSTDGVRHIGQLTPDPKNARRHNPRNIGMIVDSLQKVGAARSIVIDEDNIILAGNGVIEAAAEAGIESVRIIEASGNEIIAVRRRGLTEEQKTLLKYYDNRTGELADWDAAQIVADLEADVDLSGLWSDEEIAELVAGVMEEPPEDPGPQMDKAEELREKWAVERGQVWEIPSKTVADKSHKVMCGDSTSEEDVVRLGIIEIMPLFTDPPYGIGYDPRWLDDVGTHRQALSSRDTLANDDGTLDLAVVWRHEHRMVWGFPYLYDPAASGWVVWDKQPGVESRGIVTPIEMASTTMRKGFDMVRVMWVGYYRGKGEDKQPHPTQKPIGVYKPFIEAWTKKGDVLADYFVGSGPVHIAAEQTGRICYGMEIEPKYVAVTLQRLADMGLEPKLCEHIRLDNG